MAYCVFLVVFALDLMASVSSTPNMTRVFLQEPGSGLHIMLVPLNTQARLNCRVSEGYQIATWHIFLPGSDVPLFTEVDSIRGALKNRHGIVEQSFNFKRDSLLTINGTVANNGISVKCIAMLVDNPTERTQSNETVVVVYGPPSAPVDVVAVANGVGSLNISWFSEGIAVQFVLYVINLNASSTSDPIVVSGIEDQHYIFTVEDSTPCVVYSFQVKAMNEAGSSDPSETITRSVPALPDISPVEESLHYSLEKTMDDVLMKAVFKGCSQYPAINYTLILDSTMLGTERITKEDVLKDMNEISVQLVLEEDSQYHLFIEIANEIGSVKTQAREIATSDVQAVVISRPTSNSFSITCHYLNGSDALGCVYILISKVEGLENVNGTIRRGNDTNGLLHPVGNAGCYSEVLVFDWEADNSIGTVPITAVIDTTEKCNFNNVAGLTGADSGDLTIIIIVSVAAVISGLFILLNLVIAVILHKKGLCAKHRATLNLEKNGHETGFQNGSVTLRYSETEEHLYSTLSGPGSRVSEDSDKKLSYSEFTSSGAGDSAIADTDQHVYQVLEPPDQRKDSDPADSSPDILPYDVVTHTSATSHTYHSLCRPLPPQPLAEDSQNCVYAEIGPASHKL